MTAACAKYLDATLPLSVLDVGGRDINGTYKPIFTGNKPWQYTSLDIVAGRGVDLIVDADYKWDNVPSGAYDVVISGQVMEHVTEPWNLAAVMGRVCKAGGFVFVLAPNGFRYHREPIDCWRICPDGMRHIMTKYGGFQQLECGFEVGDTFFFGKKLL